MVVARDSLRIPQPAGALGPIQWDMSGGRKTVPLFDLLPKKPGIEDRGRVGPLTGTTPTVGPTIPPTTQSQVETKPHPHPHPHPHQQPHQQPQAAFTRPPGVESARPGGADVTSSASSNDAAPDATSDSIVVPRFAFAVIVAGLAALLVLAWAAGVKFGNVQSEQSQATKIQSDESTLLGAGLPHEPNGGMKADPVPTPAQDPNLPAPTPPTPSPVPSGPIYGYDGWTSTDPRQKGMNYLRLATLNRDQAVLTVEYIKQKGKRAVGVPSGTVDRSPGGGKNPTYFVYLLTPLSRDQYRDTALRTRIENEVKDIGKQWAKQKDRGPTDFSQPGWVKYE